ncbi:alpha/beta hydrolase [Sphingomonas sp. AOB5]|uniref:alpha/beta hydrolase n=1 Tax=Sphingomonas sp. AOB5 TaxID=3034017 RepID=UPI0023F958C1|nr:alpha/beta hydrolase [Sphingomonas sp. AOB5]MDF7775596.1 alpha/beta hydrolase [Sphingomonas sp. AOB5]
MSKLVRLAGAAMLLALSALPWSAQAQRSFEVADRPVLDDRYPVRSTAFAGGVTGLSDIVFSTIPGYRPLRLDLYLPPEAMRAKPRPLVIYVHGGGWSGGHTRHAGASANFPDVLAALAGEGFVVASIEYRLSGEAKFPAQLQDVRAAIRFLRDNSARYGIDPARVGLWGGSAGGHLAALAALTCGVPGIDSRPAGSECVQAAAIWYGVFDFPAMMAAPDGAPLALLGCTAGTPCPEDRIRAASPLSYLDRNDPPFLLIHGTADRVIPASQSATALERMRATGIPVEAILMPGLDHSLIGATPAETRDGTVRALNATFDFFHRRLAAH